MRAAAVKDDRRVRPWACALVACGLAAPSGAQVPVFRAGSDAVRVDVLATDASGAPISGLEPGDFVLRDNGVMQRIITASFEEMPLHVVLALDASGSVEGEPFERLVAAAGAVLDELHTADAATLVVFTHVITLKSLGRGRSAQARAALAQLSATGWTAAFDATWTALMSAPRPGYRPLVVLLSDGFDNRSWLGLDEVVESARRVETVLYSVRVRTPETPVAYERARRRRSQGPVRELAGTGDFLEKIAAESGGRVLLAEGDADLRPTLLRVLDEFRRRYVLGYVPEGVDPGGWHTLDVRLKGPSGKVTARRGYHRVWPGAAIR